MSIHTNINFLNANDPKFLEAKNGTSKQLLEWEEEWGSIQDRPGAVIEVDEDDYVDATDDEYGGWLIDLSKLPKNTTHIVISRS